MFGGYKGVLGGHMMVKVERNFTVFFFLQATTLTPLDSFS